MASGNQGFYVEGRESDLVQFGLKFLRMHSRPCDIAIMSRPDKLGWISFALAALFIILWIAYIVLPGDRP